MLSIHFFPMEEGPDPPMSPAPLPLADDAQPRYEIGHFVVDIEAIRCGRSFKYIVCEVVEKLRYVLHADSTHGFHSDIRSAAGRTRPMEETIVVKGGGRFRVLGEAKQLRLFDYSGSYGSEPNELCAAFLSILKQKLQSMGIEIAEE